MKDVAAAQTPSPTQEGLELLKAFMEISDPHLRQQVVALAMEFRGRFQPGERRAC